MSRNGLWAVHRNRPTDADDGRAERMSNMTIRELRESLTEISNQDMTVKELRAILFEQGEQDKEICPYDLLKMTIEK